MKNTRIYIHHSRNLARTIEQCKTPTCKDKLVCMFVVMMCLTNWHRSISNSVVYILLLCACFQMLWIDAVPMSALVSHNQSIRYRSLVE